MELRPNLRSLTLEPTLESSAASHIPSDLVSLGRCLDTPPPIPTPHSLFGRLFPLGLTCICISPSGHGGAKPAHLGGRASGLTHRCWALRLAISGSNRRKQKISWGPGAGESPGWRFSFSQQSGPHSYQDLTATTAAPRILAWEWGHRQFLEFWTFWSSISVILTIASPKNTWKSICCRQWLSYTYLHYGIFCSVYDELDRSMHTDVTNISYLRY